MESRVSDTANVSLKVFPPNITGSCSDLDEYAAGIQMTSSSNYQ